MAEQFPGERWYWRDYADRAAPVPLTSFSADVYTERDRAALRHVYLRAAERLRRDRFE